MEFSPLMKTTILLLVSDPIVRSVLKETLEGAGYTVTAPRGIGEAVDRMKQSRPDLLIVRSYVEGMTGHDAAAYLRTRCNSMKVLIVGGLLRDDRRCPNIFRICLSKLKLGLLQANKKTFVSYWRGNERREALSISGAERSRRARKRARR